MIGRVQIEADDIAHLLHEARIGGELEMLLLVRLEPERLPHTVHGGLRHTGLGGDRATAPVVRPLGVRLSVRWMSILTASSPIDR